MREGNADALEGLIRGPAEGRAGWQMGAPRLGGSGGSSGNSGSSGSSGNSKT